MLYRVQKPMTYRMNGRSLQGDLLRLQVGDVVQGVTPSGCSMADQKWMQRAQKRAEAARAPGQPPVRLVYFKAHGVVRYAQACSDLMPCKAKRATVPVEAEGGNAGTT